MITNYPLQQLYQFQSRTRLTDLMKSTLLYPQKYCLTILQQRKCITQRCQNQLSHIKIYKEKIRLRHLSNGRTVFQCKSYDFLTLYRLNSEYKTRGKTCMDTVNASFHKKRSSVYSAMYKSKIIFKIMYGYSCAKQKAII